MDETFLNRTIHHSSMMRNYFGNTLEPVNNAEMNELMENEFVKQMEPWPSKSSVIIIGDVVIIKL